MALFTRDAIGVVPFYTTQNVRVRNRVVCASMSDVATVVARVAVGLYGHCRGAGCS
jgi:hypothetical protein